MKEAILDIVIRYLEKYGLEDELDARTVTITRISNLQAQVRVVPNGVNAPRYFTIRVSENI